MQYFYMAEQQTSYERKMAQLNATVVMFKNIDGEDFLHAYDGFPWVIAAGKTVPLQYPVGMLFANHLARKILRKEKKQASGDKDKLGKPMNLYPKEEVEALINRIIVQRIEQPVSSTPSEGELMKQKADEFARTHGGPEKGKPGAIVTEPPAASIDKKQLVKELKGRGIAFDSRAPKEQLLKLLMESEAAGE